MRFRASELSIFARKTIENINTIEAFCIHYHCCYCFLATKAKRKKILLRLNRTGSRRLIIWRVSQPEIMRCEKGAGEQEAWTLLRLIWDQRLVRKSDRLHREAWASFETLIRHRSEHAFFCEQAVISLFQLNKRIMLSASDEKLSLHKSCHWSLFFDSSLD